MCMKQQVGIGIDSKTKELKNMYQKYSQDIFKKTDKKSLKIEIFYVWEMIYLLTGSLNGLL